MLSRGRAFVCDLGSVAHHVVVHSGGGHGDELESLQSARSRHNGVGGRNGRDDVLRHALRQLVRHPLQPAGQAASIPYRSQRWHRTCPPAPRQEPCSTLRTGHPTRHPRGVRV